MNDEKRPIGYANSWVRKQRRLVPWIWDGVIAAGAITLLSAPEKIGKTTLLSLLLDRRRSGGELLGRTVYPGKTILASEESDQLWALRQPPLDFGPDLLFHHPLVPPTRGHWRRFVNDVCECQGFENPYDLVVIDTAVHFMPLVQRNPRTLRWALSELHLLADEYTGVLIVNQSRTVHRPLAASADIVLEMSIPRGVTPTRRRTFTGVGRYPDTLPSLTAELNPEGTDYAPETASPTPPAPLLMTLQSLLAASPTPLTCRDLLSRWPGEPPRPDSLWRVLARGVEARLFTASGRGTKDEPFRFGAAQTLK